MGKNVTQKSKIFSLYGKAFTVKGLHYSEQNIGENRKKSHFLDTHLTAYNCIELFALSGAISKYDLYKRSEFQMYLFKQQFKIVVADIGQGLYRSHWITEPGPIDRYAICHKSYAINHSFCQWYLRKADNLAQPSSNYPQFGLFY